MLSLDQSRPQSDIPTVGEQARTILDRHYRMLLKQRPKVLKGKSPEPLHRLRVALRRLGTATEVFSGTLRLPKGARRKQLRSLGSALGTQRDLDVLLTTLREDFRPRLEEREAVWLDRVIASLERRRQKAETKTQEILTQAPFEKVQNAYAKWMEEPSYTRQAEFPLLAALPELLTPQISSLLLHPGWLETLEDLQAPLPKQTAHQLHDLRKACKRVRYQAEFFVDFYGDNFQSWLEEVKSLQDGLGLVQDSQVLQKMLRKILPPEANVPQLWTLLLEQQAQGLSLWQNLRTRYLDPEYRRDLYQMVLSPGSPSMDWSMTSGQEEDEDEDEASVNDRDPSSVQGSDDLRQEDDPCSLDSQDSR